jgi:hypothetical protein
LAQTRQADRDKVNAIADAEHREELHRVSEERQIGEAQQTAIILDMLKQNTALTESVKALTERVDTLTTELHGRFCK